jgi:hypothetical protein
MGGYIRGHVDRAALGENGPIRFVAANEGLQGDGIDLRMAGAQLDRYRANPIFGYGHRYYSREDLPIGKGDTVEVSGTQLLVDVTFDQADQFAVEVERKYRDGYLNAVSIGFDVWKWKDGKGNYWSGGIAEEWELTELSAVPVPMDAAAVVAGGRALRGELLGALDLLADPEVVDVDVELDVPRDARLVRVTNELIRSADPVLLGLCIARALRRATDTTPPPRPDVPGVDAAAASSLLAALTLGRG